MTTSVHVVELRFGHRIVHIDRRKKKLALFGQLIKSMYTRGRLFGHAANFLGDARKTCGVFFQRLFQLSIKNSFLGTTGFSIQHRRIGFRLHADLHHHGRVAAIIEDHVGTLAVAPVENLVGVLPVFLKRFALHRKDRRASFCDCRGGVILR